MKKVFAAVSIVAMLLAILVLDVPALEVTAAQEEAAGLVEKLSFSASGVFNGLECTNATLERTYANVSTPDSASLCIVRFESFDASVISSRHPQNVTADARYVAIKATSSMTAVILTWSNEDGEHFASLEWPALASTDYVLMDMQNHPGWSGKISNIGFKPLSGDPERLVMSLEWMKFYRQNPTELYAHSAVTLEPGFLQSVTKPQPPEPEPPEPVTEPDSGIVVETDWETYETQEVTGVWSDHDQIPDELPVERPGLFYEVFGDVDLTGCKAGSFGCRGGGCRSATGASVLLLLSVMGILLKKKE